VRESEQRSASLRRVTVALVALACCAYGYGQEQDPFIGAWKLVAAQANQGHWEEARAASRGLDPGLAEVESGFGWSLRAPIANALAARDGRALARELTVGACGVLFWKLEASRRAGLADYYAAKYRVEAARTFYTELLAPAVRHQDVTRTGSIHDRVVVPPDVQAYVAAELEVEAALRAAFPFVPEVKR
jgi:hypothetical protein